MTYLLDGFLIEQHDPKSLGPDTHVTAYYGVRRRAAPLQEICLLFRENGEFSCFRHGLECPGLKAVEKVHARTGGAHAARGHDDPYLEQAEAEVERLLREGAK